MWHSKVIGKRAKVNARAEVLLIGKEQANMRSSQVGLREIRAPLEERVQLAEGRRVWGLLLQIVIRRENDFDNCIEMNIFIGK